MILADAPKWLPDPNDITLNVLENVLHASPIVLGLVALAFSLQAWLDALKKGSGYAQRAAAAAGAGVSRAAKVGGLPLALAASGLVAAAQLIVLPLSYLYGN